MSILEPEIDFYASEYPSYLSKAIEAKAMKRLQKVGMHCGLEYTSLAYFASVEPYSRYAHSLGVAEIVLHFGGSKQEVLAGLYHDIATPAFSHVIDFLEGDSVKQEATEAPTRALLEHDPEIVPFLKEEGLKVEDVADYHLYPLCDNDAPFLSADRLEYTLSNFLHFHFCSLQEARSLYEDLRFDFNDKGEKEIGFQSLEKAKRFGLLALQNSLMYCRAEDRYAMNLLSKVLSLYLEQGVLTKADLWTDEDQVLARIKQSGLVLPWMSFSGLYSVEAGERNPQKKGYLYSETISTKKRFIDPYVFGKGRLSRLDPEFASMLRYFQQTTFDVSLSGYSLFDPQKNLN